MFTAVKLCSHLQIQVGKKYEKNYQDFNRKKFQHENWTKNSNQNEGKKTVRPKL